MPWLPWHLFDASTLGAYLAVAVALVAAPGPGQALVMARTLQAGARAGLLTSLGLNVGTLTHTVAAALGLSAVLMASATAFTAVKMVGAVYLLFLGGSMLWKSIRAPSPETAAPRLGPNGNGPPPTHLFLHAVVTGILNPKVALFFFAFLPQFVRPERGYPFLQFAVLGCILAGLGVVGDSLVALLTARAHARVLAGSRGSLWRERIVGTILVALGLRLAFVSRT
jgi:threonine/homoserine/homoserine lactone efflux protein